MHINYNDPDEYHLADEVEIEGYGAAGDTQKGVIVDVKETKNGKEYRIEVEDQSRFEHRYADEIIRKLDDDDD